MAEEETTNELVEIDLSIEEENISPMQENDSYLYETSKLKQPLATAPTYNPKNFYEQFAHYNDLLYCNINNNWVAIGDTTKARVRAYRVTSNQSIPDDTATVIEWNAESYDVGGDFNTGTYTFTAPRTGYYAVSATILQGVGAVADRVVLSIIKNTTTMANKLDYSDNAGNDSYNIDDVVSCAANDTITIKVLQDSGGARDLALGATYSYRRG